MRGNYKDIQKHTMIILIMLSLLNRKNVIKCSQHSSTFQEFVFLSLCF